MTYADQKLAEAMAALEAVWASEAAHVPVIELAGVINILDRVIAKSQKNWNRLQEPLSSNSTSTTPDQKL